VYATELRATLDKGLLSKMINEDVEAIYKIQEEIFKELYKNWLNNNQMTVINIRPED
jgi:hypothetical protein